ncbi:GGDEF domain-containing protein [Kineococcus endophyticus]|uniref:GGDEF domain-containing protein n=1 Tax=Kineococcus endophyticus TaxID=1181883 RepID=A0ABV3P4M6_9ACTN
MRAVVPPARRELVHAVAVVLAAAVVVLSSWSLGSLTGAVQAGLAAQLLTWLPTAAATTAWAQRRLGGGDPTGRTAVRTGVLALGVATATVATGVGFLYPVVLGILLSRSLQVEPQRRALLTSALLVLAGSVLVQVVARRCQVDPVFTGAAGDLSAAVLAVLAVVGLSDTVRLARAHRDAADALAREQAEHGAELLHAATHDALTGLLNRRGLLAALEGTSGRGLVYLDLDGFKPVNDRYGHDAGDDLLVQVAHRFRAVVREEDLVARLGGDEFVVVVATSDPVAVARVADALVAALAPPLDVLGHRVVVGAGAGWATQAGPVAAQDLLRAADVAMYERKRSRRASATGPAFTSGPREPMDQT